MELNRMSRISGKTNKTAKAEIDSVERQRRMDGRVRGMRILMDAQVHYDNMDAFRRERERCKRYTYGDQWGDIVCVDGHQMTEEEYIRSQGNVPLKNNLIRRLIRNVIGVYRSQATEPTCTARDRDEQQLGEAMTTVLQYNMDLNSQEEINARTLEEFLISGFIVHRKWYGWRNDKLDCWTDTVQPNNFFIDSNMRDVRGWDCSFLGEIHDITFEALCAQFAQSPADYQQLADIYRGARDSGVLASVWDQFGHPLNQNHDLLVTTNAALCRVIEVWRKETKGRYRCHDYNTGEVYKIEAEDYKTLVVEENKKRLMYGASSGIPTDEIPLIEAEWFVDDYWYYYYITPMGDILAEGESPYAHKGHPYVFKAYPFVDGEIHSFVSDVIDQQRYVNRLVTLNDWVIRASAKGLLMIPEDCIPKGSSVKDFADSWAKYNGVIVFKPSKSGQMPKQVANNATNIGTHEQLAMQLKFFEDISGVNGALQGKPGFSGMSAALYSQQTQNATTSLLDILSAFNTFEMEAAKKNVKNIQQFYDDKRVYEIAGNAGIAGWSYTDPTKIRDTEFDMSIAPSTATPAYRALMNDFLMQMLQNGQIDIKMLLEVGSFPFADQLLQLIKTREEEQASAMAEQTTALPPSQG